MSPSLFPRAGALAQDPEMMLYTAGKAALLTSLWGPLVPLDQLVLRGKFTQKEYSGLYLPTVGRSLSSHTKGLVRFTRGA